MHESLCQRGEQTYNYISPDNDHILNMLSVVGNAKN